jgi:hypothetical protein
LVLGLDVYASSVAGRDSPSPTPVAIADVQCMMGDDGKDHACRCFRARLKTGVATTTSPGQRERVACCLSGATLTRLVCPLSSGPAADSVAASGRPCRRRPVPFREYVKRTRFRLAMPSSTADRLFGLVFCRRSSFLCFSAALAFSLRRAIRCVSRGRSCRWHRVAVHGCSAAAASRCDHAGRISLFPCLYIGGGTGAVSNNVGVAIVSATSIHHVARTPKHGKPVLPTSPNECFVAKNRRSR